MKVSRHFAKLISGLIIFIIFKLLSFVLYFALLYPHINNFNTNEIVYIQTIIKLFNLIVVLCLIWFLSKKMKILTKFRSEPVAKNLFVWIAFAFISYFVYEILYLNIFDKTIISGTMTITLNSILTSVLLAPLGEELFYRVILVNYLSPTFDEKEGGWMLTVVFFISLLFACAHLVFTPVLFFSHFLFSIFITLIYYRIRSFWFVFLIHALFNLLIQLNFPHLINEINFNFYLLIVFCVIFFISTIYSIQKLFSKNQVNV
jgi:membrane protease YdiL (CAAX protease family)